MSSQYCQAQFSRDLGGHIGSVVEVAFSPDSSRLATCGQDGAVVVWNVAKGVKAFTLDEPEQNISCVAFSKNGNLLATGHRNGVAKLWDTSSGKNLKMIPPTGPGEIFGDGDGHWQVVSCVDFSLDGKLLATGSHDKQVKLWDVANGKEIKTLEHAVNVGDVCFSPDGKQLATGCMDGTVILWEVGSGKKLHSFNGEYDQPTTIDVQFSRVRKNIAVCYDDRINIIQIASKKILWSHEHLGAANFSPDGELFVSTSSGSDASLFDVATGERKQILPGHAGRPSCFSISPDGKYLAVGNDRNGVVKVWDLKAVLENKAALNEEIDKSKWLGEKVMPKPDAVFQDDAGVIPLWRQELPMKVVEFREGWLVGNQSRVRSESVVILEEADEFYKSHLLDHEESAAASELKSVLDIQNQNFEQALEDLSTILEANSKSVMAHSLRGDCWVAKEEFEKAIEDYSQAIKHDPNFASALFRRGLANAELDRQNEALSDFTRAIECRHDYGAAYHRRGKILLSLGRDQEAVDDFTQSLSTMSDQVEIYVDRATAWSFLDAPENAVSDCNESLRLDADYGPAYKARSWANKLLGKKAESRLDELQAYRLSPSNPSHYAKLPILHFDMRSSFFGSKIVTVARRYDGKEVRTFRRAPGAVWQPRGNWFAYFSAADNAGRQSLMLADLDGETKKLWTSSPDQAVLLFPVWSPDGKKLAFLLASEKEDPGSSFQLQLIILGSQAGAVEQTINIPDGVVSAMPTTPSNEIRWSPDGKHVLVSAEISVVVNLQNGLVTKIGHKYIVPAWTADGQGLFYFGFVDGDPHLGDFSGFYRRDINKNGRDVVADATQLKKAKIFKHPGLHSARMRTSATGRYLAMVVGTEHDFTEVGNLRIYKLNNDKRLELETPLYNQIVKNRLIIHFQWSPDDTHIAALTLRDWNKLAVETLKISTGEWRELHELNLNIQDFGTPMLDFIGWHKALSWSN